MLNKCIVCHGTEIKTLYQHLLSCKKCGYVFADLDLSDEAFADLYKRNYFFGEEYSNYLADKQVLQKNFKARLKVLRKFLDPPRHRQLLEIGCAYGFFLAMVKNEFEGVQGLDISAEATRYAQEELHVNAIQADPSGYDFGVQKFDVVCMWDTIEHLKNPGKCLENVGRHTESGAILTLTTGDIESWNARFKKDRWRLIHPPSHAHYFSKKTISKLLDAYGFDVLYNRYCGFYRSFENIAYNILVLREKGPKFYKLLEQTKLLRFSLYLNLYDIMYVIARKR